MRPGVRLGVDVGSVRVGVAASDASAMLASPVETLKRDPRGGTDLERLRSLALEREAVEVVVGLPRSLNGSEGPAALAARDYARALAELVAPVPVRLADERLSTVSATRSLIASAPKAGARKRRQQIDQAAAVVILQSALDHERAVGSPPGDIVPTSPA
ncbi:MAG: putative pre6S rRNA nuclease [Frankiales bacterium]|jgi:putative Holliday junction resolvase|nr:putative pre6S rRNA nuclease [Frankiales bacterium]